MASQDAILMHKLFQEYYKKQQDNIYLKIDKEWFYKHNATSYQNEDFIEINFRSTGLWNDEADVRHGKGPLCQYNPQGT